MHISIKLFTLLHVYCKCEAKLENTFTGPLLIIHKTSQLFCSFVIHCQAKQAKQATRYIDLGLKSNRPKISPRGVQNEKIENPQTLAGYRSGWTISRKNTVSSIRFLFYANGDKIGLAALTSVSRAPNNALFELRLKINKTVNLAIEYLNEKNTCLRTVWNIIFPIHRKLNFWAIFAFLQYFTHFGGQKKGKIDRVK